MHTISTLRSKPAPRIVLAVNHLVPSGLSGPTPSPGDFAVANGENIKQSKAKLIIIGSRKRDMVVVVQEI